VVKKKAALVCLFLAILGVSIALSFTPTAHAQVTYSVNQEWLKAWVNTDGSVDFLYNVSFSYLSGSPQGLFDLGMPTSGFQIHYVQDQSGVALQYQDISSGGYTGIEITLKKPIVINQPYTFLVYASVSSLLYQDTTNPGNVGMQFFPGTFQNAAGTEDLRVEFELPPGVPQNDTRSPPGLDFDNVFTDENRTAVYWERATWAPGEAFMAGVSFPQQYVNASSLPTPWPSTNYTENPFPTTNTGGGFPIETTAVVGGVIFVLIAIGVIAVAAGAAKSAYQSPSIAVEALGANRSLTAVEAGLVLGLKPVRVITMMLYGLLHKHMVIVTESQPVLKLQKMEKPAEPASADVVAEPASPRYYEIDFLNAIKPDGTLDEEALAETYRGLVNTVNQKLKGYSRQDTENYYRSIVDKAWSQVTQAGTADLMGDAFDKNLEWLLADHNFDENLHSAFPPGIIIVPSPMWWWYWSGPHFPSGTQTTVPISTTGAATPSPPPFIRPSPTTPAPIRAQPVAGQDFANGIVQSIQGASNNIVRNVQDFANKLVPFAQQPARSENSVAGRPSCVCACHACACHCACVSCACACAGGGAR
jgi:hypothetical protein